MQKIRINDLARELEVKSKAILDILPKVGVTEKKTHSSSIEVDEAERVRAYVQGQGGGSGQSKRPAASGRPGEDITPKFDLSHISKPGDVLKAILEKQQAPQAPPPAPPKPAAPATPPPTAKPSAPPVTTAQQAPVAPPAPPQAEAPRAPRVITPQPRTAPPIITRPAAETTAPEAPVTTAPAAPEPVSAPPSPATEIPAAITEPIRETPPPPPAVEPPVAAEPAAPATTEIAEPVTPATVPPAEAPTPVPPVAPIAAPPSVTPPAVPPASATHPPAQTPAAAQPGRPVPGQPLVPPGRRVIMPQTGPRPVYKAPAPPPPRPGAPSHAGLNATGEGMRMQPGRPVPGRPIFERPGRPGAPGAPGSRPPLRPGERRPMHPTRQGMGPGGPPRPGFGGPRPIGVGPGMPPPPGTAPGRPGQRPAPARRPGGRYQPPRGPQEGPMKGYIPPSRQQSFNEPLPITRNITITEGISVKDLAEKLDVRAKDVIARLLQRGVFATINQTLDADLASEMAKHFGAATNVVSFEDAAQQELLEQAIETGDEAALATVPRAPVVTIMGHVDHGKTSLLDAIRETDVAGGEAGGITQHIGAYKVRIGDENSPAYGREIVFLDTPGHEAFTRMRARGAKVTDIVVIVVAADDGVMPQTLEAIDHAKAANVPLIVAVNKVDKPDAQPDRVKKQLADRGLLPENWGGNTVFVDVSAKAKTNLNLLLEMICLVADLGNLQATPDRAATGSVVEAKLDRGRGPVATILIQNGSVKTGDNFVVGNIFGRVRAMFDDRGNALGEAGPSTPVEVLGLEGLPQAGDQFIVVADREKARNIAEYREQKAREAQLAKSTRVSLEGLAEQIKSAGVKELPIILKGDVGGSVEVIRDVLEKQSNEKVKIKVIHTGVGAITETDVLLASASNAIIIGFNVRPERKASEVAEQENVDIRLHSIIYELQDEIRAAMTGLLEPVLKEVYHGRAEVRDTFRIPKVGMIAGCQVIDGLIKRDDEVRLLRDNVVVFKGKIGSLRRFKDDAAEVRNGMECGIGIANYGDVKVGDVIEAFVIEKVAATLV